MPAARYKHSFATPVYQRNVGAAAVDGKVDCRAMVVDGDSDGRATAVDAGVEGMFIFGGEGYRFAQDYHKDLWFFRSNYDDDVTRGGKSEL